MTTEQIDYVAEARAAMVAAREARAAADSALVREKFASMETRKQAVYAKLADGKGPLFASLRDMAAARPGLVARLAEIERDA